MENLSIEDNIPQPIKDLRELEITNKRRVWKPFMEKYACQKIAEIGVFEGFNFNLMIQHNPEVAIGVDAWISDGIPARNDSGYTQERLNEMHNKVMEMVKDKPFVKIYREYTHNAAERFPDNYFDLIYIDADHTYEGCLQDIKDWYPKVKSGGFVTGDDYTRARAKYTGVVFGVIEAVDEFFKEKNLTVYTLPRNGWAVIKP
jgi:hypothetical protein